MGEHCYCEYMRSVSVTSRPVWPARFDFAAVMSQPPHISAFALVNKMLFKKKKNLTGRTISFLEAVVYVDVQSRHDSNLQTHVNDGIKNKKIICQQLIESVYLCHQLCSNPPSLLCLSFFPPPPHFASFACFVTNIHP